jgi:hypothetical protein
VKFAPYSHRNPTRNPRTNDSIVAVHHFPMASLDPPYQVNHGYPDMEAYQTIAFHPSYQRMSLEELRLKDYREGFGRPTGEPQTAADNMTARSAAASNSSFQLASIRASPDQHHK